MTKPPSSPESWAYLSRVVEGPSIHLQHLLSQGKTADQIAHGVRTRASWIGGLGPQTQHRYTWDQPAQDLERAKAAGYKLVTSDSPEWPGERIKQVFHCDYPESGRKLDLNQDAVAPHALWVKGNANLATLLAQSVGIVGTRTATAYGRGATENLVQGLAKHQYTIVSGGALGIDTAAHRAALDCGAPTVVVAACGPGYYYPLSNEMLFERVCASGGAIITEYPPGTTPDRHRFLTRNRLVAGLTQGTVLVEAAFRSGALNTLKWVNTFNGKAMAVPGPITATESLGTNLAIQKEQATMVLNADQIHEMISKPGTIDEALQQELNFPKTLVQQLSHNELRIYDALPRAGEGARLAEDIAADAGLTIGLTVHILMDLAKRGVVQRERKVWSRTE